jgi:type VI secretion system secreted protein VgrG
LGASTVTNTGSTILTGDLGIYPGTSLPGGITLTGTVHLTDTIAMDAQTDAAAAYATLAAMSVPIPTVLTGIDLGTVGVLSPGVYFFSSTAQLTGTLILDANHVSNALFVFQIGSTLNTAAGSAVEVINGGAGDGVFWQVGTSATIGAGTAFAGNILASASITMYAGATICGRALALNAAVTMTDNTISDACGANFNNTYGDFGSAGFAGNTEGVPEPGTVPLLCVGLLALTLYDWRSRKRMA